MSVVSDSSASTWASRLRRPRWTAAWRVLARDRARVRVVRAGGSTVHGVPVRVGADFVELDPGGEAVAGPVLVPYPAITAAYVPRDPADGG